MVGGISVGNVVIGGSGTIGFSVFDNITREGMILSNWHVLCGRLTCALGESIIQPGQGSPDTGQPTDEVAKLYRAVLTDRVDAALGRLTGSRFLSQNILGRDTIFKIGTPLLGMTVRKSGRSSGVTHATITDISADIDILYDKVVRHFLEQVVIEGTDASLPGDSGSIWGNDQGEAIGLNFAGINNGTIAFANPFQQVAAALNINLNDGITMQDFVAIGYLNLLW